MANQILSKTSKLGEAELFNFGYKILGPVVVDFVSKLSHRKSKGSKLVFLGRDGYIFYKLYRLLYPQCKHVLYVHLNRVITHQIYFNKLNNQLLNYLSTYFKVEGVWGVVSVFGLSNSTFSINYFEFLEKNNIHSRSFIDDNFIKLFLNELTLKNEFEKELKCRKNNALKYCYKQGFLVDNISYELVDVGWNGSIFKKISGIFSNVECSHLFIATDKVDGITQYISFDNNYANYASKLVANRELIEFSLAESISTVQYINDDLLPVNDKSSPNRQQVCIHNGLLESYKVPMSESNEQRLENLVTYLSNAPREFIEEICDVYPNTSIDDSTTVSFKQLLSNENCLIPGNTDITSKQTKLYNFLEWTKILNGEVSIVLYGAGSGAEYLLPFVKDKCECILDLNTTVHNNSINGVLIIPPSQIRDSTCVIVVTVIGRKVQILNTLKTHNGKVYFLEDYL